MNPPDLDRHILLGLLALRAGLIDRDALARALAAWGRRPERSLEEVLAEHGEFPPEDRAILRELNARALARHGSPQETLLALAQPDPSVTDLKEAVVADGGASPTVTLPAPGTPVNAPAAVAEERFQLLALHARGGLGEVYRARDEALEREVAVKQIRDEHADNPHYRADFLREAHLTGLLEHPGVVPVYGLGRHPDGRPFYAMRFIEGENLRAAVGRYHAPNQAEDQRRLALRELLRRFIDVCNTLAFAHARGIIHRDLKPDNVMLGKYGETLVVDWGLARFIDQKEGEVTTAVVGGGGTVAGQVKGTPAYMAPEQASGQQDLGPACDIYGLGATLFYLLTGAPPVEGANVHAILLAVQEGRVSKPQDVRRDVPAGLAAITVKAMSLKAADRYATATELAGDISRWLADEPPTAYREPAGERLWRLARRYRTASAAFGLALVGITLVSLLALFYVNRARHAESLAYAVGSVRDLTDGVEATRWTEDHLARLDGRIAELARLDPGAVPAAQERVNEGLAQAFKVVVHRSTSFTEEAQQLAAAQLRALRERVPEQAAALQAEFNQRLRLWEPLVELKAPFANLASVFPLERVLLEGKELGAVPVEPAPPGVSVLRTLTTAAGHTQQEVAFAPSWATAPVVGVVLNAGPTGGYECVVSSFEYSASAARDLRRRDPLQNALSAGERVYASISRDGVVLTQTRVLLPPGELRLVATREEGDRITFQVNNQPRLVFHDQFATTPAAAPFGLIWPAGVQLASLRISRQALPIAPSPLERGDDLFAQLRFDEALTFYREQARSSDPAAAAQARFKAGLCLYELGRKDEAAAALRLLRQDRTAPESLRTQALARLWLWELVAGRLPEAQALLAEFPRDLKAEQLAAQIPAPLRNQAINTLRKRGPRWRSVWGADVTLPQIQQAVRIEELIDESAFERRQTRWKLIDLYRSLGQLAVARVLMNEMLDDKTLPDDERVAYLRDLVWMQIEGGQAQEALNKVEQTLAEHTAAAYLSLHLERARLLAAQEKWAQAEKAVDDYFAKVKPGEGIYADYAEASLLKGFLRVEQNDEVGAKKAWRGGLLRDWPGGLPALPRGLTASGVVQHQFATGQTFNVLLASLVGDMTADEADAYTTQLYSGAKFTEAAIKALTQESFKREEIQAVLLGNCAHPRGRAIARRMVYRQLDFREFHILSFRQTLAVAFNLFAITGKITPEVDELMWIGSGKLFKAFDDGHLDADGMGDMLRLWQGQAGEAPADTWARLAPKFEPAGLRIPAAYLFGRRLLVLKRPADARLFLEEVARCEKPEYKVERALAQEDLRKLPP